MKNYKIVFNEKEYKNIDWQFLILEEIEETEC